MRRLKRRNVLVIPSRKLGMAWARASLVQCQLGSILIEACLSIVAHTQHGSEKFEDPSPAYHPLQAAWRSRLGGIVDKNRVAHNIDAIDKTPVTAIERIVAVIAKHEIFSGGNNYFAVDHMILKHIFESAGLAKIR